MALAVAALVLVLLLVLVVAVRYAARAESARLLQRAAELDPAARRAEWEHELEARRAELAADRAQVSVLAPLFVEGGGSDAGPVLNAMLEWPVPWPDRPRAALRLPPEVSGMLASWGEGDVKRLAQIDFGHLDLTWMRQLSQFDHWDLERHSPWDDVSAADEAAEWYRDREPRLERLTPWVKLRLMKGLADAEPWDALAETRQLARLLLSTQSLLASVEAMLLLHLEREAYVAALGSHPEKLANWSGVGNGETGPATIRYWRALPALLSPAAPPAVFDDAVRERTPGTCAALREAVRSALALRPLLEQAHASGYRRLEALMAQLPGCRLTRLRAALGSPSLPARWRALSRVGGDGRLLGEDEGSAPATRRLALLLSLPLRAAVGEPLLYDAAIAALHASR